MPATRQQIEFEKSLIEALSSQKVTTAIVDALIMSLTSKLAEKFNQYENKIASLETKVTKLETEITKLKESNNLYSPVSIEKDKNSLSQKVDILQQNAKNNNIRIFGLKETDDENLLLKVNELFINKLKISLNKNDIVSTYRVGQKTANRPRHVIVTFKDNLSKHNIFNKKKLLRGCNIVFKEDLTVDRLKIVKSASEKFGYKNVWTVNGIVYAKTTNGVEKILPFNTQ